MLLLRLPTLLINGEFIRNEIQSTLGKINSRKVKRILMIHRTNILRVDHFFFHFDDLFEKIGF